MAGGDPGSGASRPATLQVMAVWLAVNGILFWGGWYAGGNDLSSRGIEASVRNLLYALVFGSGQNAVLLNLLPRPAGGERLARILAWPLLTALAFALGVRLWKTARVHLPGIDAIPDSLQLAAFLGVLMPLARAGALRVLLPTLPRSAYLAWGLADAAGWVAIEYLSYAHGYSGWRIPAWAVLTSIPTGLALARIGGALKPET